jgi:hypothetical protein
VAVAFARSGASVIGFDIDYRKKTELQSIGNSDPSTSSTAPWRIYNISNNHTVEVRRVVTLLEQELGRKAKVELVPTQPGDVPETCAEFGAGRWLSSSHSDRRRCAKVRCLISAILPLIELEI